MEARDKGTGGIFPQQEPLVKIKLREAETEIECFVDTGTTLSVLNAKKLQL